MRNDFSSNYLAHFGLKKGAKRDDHKYYARVDLPNGLYRYFYDAKEYLAYMQGKAKDVYAHKEEILQDKINQGVSKLEQLYNKLDKENKYMTDDWNYDKKIKQVAETKEWQDIVKRKDPEYVYKDKEGKTVYDIDSYLSKKKHPVLDAADDVVMGRNVTINKLDKQAAVAGVADYAKTYVALAALGTKFMLEKFKFSQGSYKEEKQAAIDYAVQNKDKIVKAAEMADAASSDPRVMQAITDGEKYIKQYAGNVQNVNVDTISQQTGLSKEDVEQLKKDYATVKTELEKVSSTDAKNTVKTVASAAAKEVITKNEPKDKPKATTSTPKKEPDNEEKPKSKKEAPKYVEKVKTSDGKYRYFYTQEEYQAYLDEEKRKKNSSKSTEDWLMGK